METISHSASASADVRPRPAPLNLGLNDGTYCPAACVEVLARFASRTGLRNYPTADNKPLRDAVARLDGVAVENVFLANGSGPLLKQGIPHVLRTQIRSSLRRSVAYLVNRGGYPVFTPRLTYSKVPQGLAKLRMPVRLLPLRPEDGFRLDLSALRRGLAREDGLVYLANPNNPTGNVLLGPAELASLLTEFPRSTFWIDEAYVHYVPPERYAPIAPLVARHPNVIVSRSFSFAYGLASARIGYLLAAPSLVQDLERGVTPYRLGGLQEELALAALADSEHLEFVRRETAAQRRVLLDGLRAHPALEVWDSETNFLLGRRVDGVPARALADALAQRGVRIKTFEPQLGERYDELFRVTVGLADENEQLLAHVAGVLGEAARA